MGSTVVGNGVAVMGRDRGSGKLTHVVLHDILEPYSKVQVYHTTMLSTYRNLIIYTPPI